MSWVARMVRFLADEETETPRVVGLQPRLFYGLHDVWDGHFYPHDCETCENTAWIELLSCTSMLGLMPAGRPDPASLRLRPAIGLGGLNGAGWGAVPAAGDVVWEHIPAVCPALPYEIDAIVEAVRLDLLGTDGDCRQRRQPNCVVARLVDEIDRLREEKRDGS